MATITQISSLLNDAVKQLQGEEALDNYSLEDIVDLGQVADKTWKDNFYKAVYDRIYKTVFSVRGYYPADNNIMRDSQTYGAILEKIYIDPMKAQDNEAWELGNAVSGVTSVDPFIINKQTVKVKVFNKRNTYSLPFTIFDNQMNTAFLSAGELVKFVSNLFLAVDNDMRQFYKTQELWTKANFIAEKLYYKTQHTDSLGVINLLAEYKKVFPESSLTAVTCRGSKEFLRFSAMTISQFLKKMTERNVLFNNEGYYRFTPKEDLHLNVLSDFAELMKYNLQSDTYHKELVELPRYEEVLYWQGSGTEFDFNDCSTISITSSEGHTIEQSNIVAVAFDHDALGMTIWNERTTSQYNASGEYTNYFRKADIGIFNDVSENGIVFIIEDPVTTDEDQS